MAKERDEFIAIFSREMQPTLGVGPALDLARKLMRLAKTHGRLQTALCNGDWPADNGERATVECPICGLGWAVGTVSKINGCKDCRIEAQITKLLDGHGITPKFGGDPRGCTVKLVMPSGITNDWGREGLCVPQ